MIEPERLIGALQREIGKGQVLTSPRVTRRYRKGYRADAGAALAVVRPRSLIDMWRALAILVAHDVAIIVQAANTGLTGGSTPDDRIERPVVIINTMLLTGTHMIAGGEQVVCLPGATLYSLERIVRAHGREPHSVIGSSCFGASVIGGVCNNSGGALVRRGPAYTELALFAQIGADGSLTLVNRLGIDLGSDVETMLHRLEAGDFVAQDTNDAASDRDYHHHVRAIDKATPARFNADPRRLHDASGSAGKIVVFAVRLDTFPQEEPGATFYIGTNRDDELSRLRREMLSGSAELPVSAEYLHRDAFDIADRYGRDTFIAIRRLGTDRLPKLFALKARVDGIGELLGFSDLSERLLQLGARILSDHLPPRMREWRNRYEHHLILTVSGKGLASTRHILGQVFRSGEGGDFFECTPDEAAKAALHRFVTAGAAVRYRAVNRRTTQGIVALDVALPRNTEAWFGPIPTRLDGKIVAAIRYGHFFCHVFHRDYIVARDVDIDAFKADLLLELEERGAQFPAEHNVGRQYVAKPALADFYRKLDPKNRFNPGIGLTPTGPDWTGKSNLQESAND